MKRRKLLSTGAITLLSGGVVGTVIGQNPIASKGESPSPITGSSQPDYLGQQPIVYDRDRLQLRAHPNNVQQGETITFEISNTGDSQAISIGCHTPWAIQIYEDSEWKHAVWTDEWYYNMCFNQIGPSDTISVKVPLSQTALSGKDGLGEVTFEFTPGKYRFILIKTTPRLAVDFRILGDTE